MDEVNEHGAKLAADRNVCHVDHFVTFFVGANS